MSCPHRKQFPSSSTVYSTETMLLPRLQRDPRPVAYNVQTTVLPMDMYVHISAFTIDYCSILSAYRLMFIVVCALSRLQSCGSICHHTVTFVFTVNTERNRDRKTCSDRFWILICQSTSKNAGCHITLVLLFSLLFYNENHKH